MYRIDLLGAIIRESDNATIPQDEHNADYRVFRQWLDEGGELEVPQTPDTGPAIRRQIAERRYRAEVAGITVAGIRVDTDDRSKLLINGAALEAVIDPAYTLEWKTPAGFVPLTASQVIAVARAVRAHVQACFDREADLLAALTDGSLTDTMLEEGWPNG